MPVYVVTGIVLIILFVFIQVKTAGKQSVFKEAMNMINEIMQESEESEKSEKENDDGE